MKDATSTVPLAMLTSQDPVEAGVIASSARPGGNLTGVAFVSSETAWGPWARAGSLLSYGPDLDALVRRAATHVDKIRKGATSADLPVEQPTTSELVINLKTAKARGLTIAPSLTARADRVIE